METAQKKKQTQKEKWHRPSDAVLSGLQATTKSTPQQSNRVVFPVLKTTEQKRLTVQVLRLAHRVMIWPGLEHNVPNE